MSQLPQLIMLVPRLPPMVDGVGDYSFQLAKQLRQMQVCHVQFLVGDPEFQDHSQLEGFESYTIAERSSQALLSALNQCNAQQSTLLVQFSGYGFAAWGNPKWLIEGLKEWKVLHSEARLATMFHELYNKLGYPWQHNFWVHHTQKRIISDLANLSQHIVTNMQEYGETLSFLSSTSNRDINILPVFSNVAELRKNPSIQERHRSMVIFGQSYTRRRSYQDSAKFIQEVCEQLNIKHIIDIGPSTELEFTQFLNVPVIEKGRLDIEDVSMLLKKSLVGFINYEVKRLAKSGTFAAYSAHGLIPIVSQDCNLILDSLQPGQHYINPSSLMPHQRLESSQDILDYYLSQVSNRVFNWYQGHNLEAHAKEFSSILNASNLSTSKI